MIRSFVRSMVALTAIWLALSLVRAEAETKNAAEEAIFREQAKAYAKAFAAGDAAALANMWTHDGLLIDIGGQEYRGRHRIQQYFQDSFKRMKPQPLAIAVEQVRFPNSETAIEEGTTRLIDAPTPSISRYVAVHVKQNGQWQMASVTETPYKSANTSYYMRDLSWLVGSWDSQMQGRAMRLDAEWIANRNYIRCTFHPAQKTSMEHTRTQLIGYNPLTQCIVSWHFGPTGGFGYSEWVKNGNKYVELARMVEPDGTRARATNTLTRIDNNTFTWQSTNRMLGGARLPDTAEVKVVRASASK